MGNFSPSPLPPPSVPAILGFMPPRTLTFVILAAALAAGSPLSAKEKSKPAKKAARTWQTVVDYVFKNGDEDSFKAPATRTLGYDVDEVFAKSMGLDEDKSKDGRDHSIFVVYDKDEAGVAKPKEIIFGSILVKETESAKEIDSYEIRATLAGSIIRGMRAKGIVGQVVQTALPPESKELLAFYKKESAFYLKEIDLAQLTK